MADIKKTDRASGNAVFAVLYPLKKTFITVIMVKITAVFYFLWPGEINWKKELT